MIASLGGKINLNLVANLLQLSNSNEDFVRIASLYRIYFIKWM